MVVRSKGKIMIFIHDKLNLRNIGVNCFLQFKSFKNLDVKFSNCLDWEYNWYFLVIFYSGSNKNNWESPCSYILKAMCSTIWWLARMEVNLLMILIILGGDIELNPYPNLKALRWNGKNMNQNNKKKKTNDTNEINVNKQPNSTISN